MNRIRRESSKGLISIHALATAKTMIVGDMLKSASRLRLRSDRVAVVARDYAIPCDACEPVLAEPITC